MPRVAIKKKEYMVNDLSKWIIGKMYEKHLKQENLAQAIGISQPAFCNRLKKGLFSYEDMLTLFKELEATDEEKLRLMTL